MVIHLHCDNNSHSLPRTRNRLCKRKAMMGECLSIIAYVQPHPASTNIVRNRVIWRHSFFARKYTIAFHCLPVRSFLVISVGGAHWVKCETLKHMVKFTGKWRRDCLLRKWKRLGKLLWTKFFWNVPHSRTARRATVFCSLRFSFAAAIRRLLSITRRNFVTS